MINGISLVVCCYNSEKRLPKVLDYINKQEIEDEISWEVLIVDNASTDRTSEVAREEWKRKDIPLKVVYEPKAGLSNARLTGFASSSYDIISFIDDDNWIEKRWIQKVFHIMSSDSNIGIMGGRGEAVFETDPPFWFEEHQSAFAVGPYGKITGKQREKLINGAGMSVRKSAWDKLRSEGFDFLLSGRKGKLLSSGEDVELCRAFLLAGYDLYYDNDLQFYHYMPAERLKWDYLVNLFRAFGRAAPIMHLYGALLHKNGFNRLKYTNTFLSTTRCFYNYLCFLPRMIPLLFTDNEGDRKVLNFVFVKYRFLESLRLFFVFPTYVSRIKNAAWYNKKA